MSKEFKESFELYYTPKDVVEIINDFRTLYSKLDSKIRQFILTQPTFLDELRMKLKSEIGFLPPGKKDVALASYGIIVTEDIVKNYDPFFFADDISALLEATNKKNTCTDDEFIGLLAAFLNSLKTIKHSMNEINQNLVEYKGMGITDEIIESLLIFRNLGPALTETSLCYEVGEFNIDIRFLAACFANSFETTLEKSEIIEKANSTGKLHTKMISTYPIDEGDETNFDLLNILLVEPYYFQLTRAFNLDIDKRKRVIQEHFTKAKEELSVQIKEITEFVNIGKLLETINLILEKIKNEEELSDELKNDLENNFILYVEERLEIEIEDSSKITSEEYLEASISTLFEVFEEYPQFALPLIKIEDFTRFIDNLDLFIEETKKATIIQIQKKIRNQLGDKQYTPKNLVKVFVSLLIKLISDPLVVSQFKKD